MKRIVKKLSIIVSAALLIGVGAGGLAMAGDRDAEKQLPMFPPMIAKIAEKLDLTDSQKAELESLKERQQALRDEFWAVFTEEQKTTMLEMMMKHRKKREDDRPFRKRQNQSDGE